MHWFKGTTENPIWEFTEQEDRPQYSEGDEITSYLNPVWNTDFTGEPITPNHDPCGYWWKQPFAPTRVFQANLFGSYNAYEEIWAVSFDPHDASLVYRGSFYTSIEGARITCAIIALSKGRLLTVRQDGGSFILTELSDIVNPSTEMLEVINDYAVFNPNDVAFPDYGTLIDAEDINKLFYVEATRNNLPLIVRFNRDTLEREARGFYSSVVTGTDSNLYADVDYYTSWGLEADYKPISGTYWGVTWRLIPDGECDSPVVSWGVDSVSIGSTSIITAIYHGGYLYIGLYQTPYAALKKIDPLTLEIVSEIITNDTTKHPYRMVANAGKLYTICGVTNATVRKYDAGTLVEESSVLLPSGSVSGDNAGDVIVCGEYLVVSTNTYTASKGKLYLLNLSDLSTVASILFPDSDYEGQRLCYISDEFIAVGWNDGVSIYRVPELAEVARLNLKFLTGYSQNSIVSKVY